MKEIKDYLHLYLGCPCKGKDGSMIYTLISVGLDMSPLLKDKFGNQCVIFDFKPILRQLSDMTEEEKTEYNKIRHRKGYMAQIHAEQFYYLLSKHFDLFGLIEAGLAINKTLKNKK